MMLLAWIMFLAWATSFVLHGWGTILALGLRRSRKDTTEVSLPPFSLLKPVCGLDPELEENLLSFLTLDYPQYEVHFCVPSESDPAFAIVNKVVARAVASQVRVHVWKEQAAVSPNPKVNNMWSAYCAVAYDTVLITDSNVRATADLLKLVAQEFSGTVGMVSGVVSGRDECGWGGQLESVFLNSFYARWMHLSHRLGYPCVIGKIMGFKKTEAERFGGLKTLGRFLNEDYMAGLAMLRLGWQISYVARPIHHVVGARSFTEFWSRHLRWGRIRKSQAPLAFFIEPFAQALGANLLGASWLWTCWPDRALVFFLWQLGLWWFLDVLLLSRQAGFFSWKHAAVWWIRECLALPLWVHALCGDHVHWRGQRLRVSSGCMIS